MRFLSRSAIGGLFALTQARSLAVASASSAGANANGIHPRISLGAGCYWGTEKFVIKDFQEKHVSGSIKSGAVGFMHASPNAQPNPTYREVCSGRTGYVEVYDVELNDPTEETYEKLLKHYFSFHDPTTFNRQGMYNLTIFSEHVSIDLFSKYFPNSYIHSLLFKFINFTIGNDRGSQYGSVIFCYDDKQIEIANKIKNEIQDMVNNGQITNYAEKLVTTEIILATTFYPADEDHQGYLFKNPGGYCNHAYRF
jgi:peptide-methionine (S)-S-oxide reductase